MVAPNEKMWKRVVWGFQPKSQYHQKFTQNLFQKYHTVRQIVRQTVNMTTDQRLSLLVPSQPFRHDFNIYFNYIILTLGIPNVPYHMVHIIWYIIWYINLFIWYKIIHHFYNNLWTINNILEYDHFQW